MEASGTPTPAPEPPPPPPPPAASDDGKAGGGMRALAVLLALVLGFGAAVMIVAGAEISDSPTVAECLDDPTVIPSDGECFDGSDTNQTIVTVLCFASGAVAALSALLALGFAISGRRGRLVVQTASLAILLAVIALII